MKVPISLASLAIVFIACTPYNGVNADYDVKKYCQLVPDHTKFPSLDSCQTYYTCLPDGSTSKSNCGNNAVFDKDTQSCIASSDGSCALMGNPCKDLHEQFALDGHDCNKWHYCENGITLSSGLCPKGQIFDEKEQACVYGKCDNDNNLDDITNICKIMQNGQFFGDFDNCAIWHRCSGLKKQDGKCNPPLIYDSKSRMCLASNGNMCAGPNIECSEETEDKFFAHPKICSIYYKCTQSENNWLWKEIKCQYGEYYDTETKKCENRKKATPVEGCDRCEFSSSKWVNDVDPKCTSYLFCNNGKQNGKGSCGDNAYFDEGKQACVGESKLDDYRKDNGACRKDDETTTTVQPGTDGTTVQTGGGVENTTDQTGGEQENTTDQTGTGDESTTDQTGTGDESTTDQTGTGDESTTDQTGTGDENTTDQTGTGDESTTDQTGTGDESTTDQTGTGDESTTVQTGTGDTQENAAKIDDECSRDEEGCLSNQ